MIMKVLLMTIISLLMLPSFSLAQHGHMGGEKQQPMKMQSTDVLADELEATFMVMKNESHTTMLKNMKMKEDIESGSTHNIPEKGVDTADVFEKTFEEQRNPRG